ncbi:MAG: helix-turn-helix domain-containing protein [Dongiaceae bacterium]
MARPTRHGPALWIAGALRLLAEGGPEAVGIEALARRLGATKGSFYHHFDDRPALLAALLAHWETRAAMGVIDRVEAAGGSAADRLWALMETVAREGAASPEPAIRLWARTDPGARAALARIDRARLDYLEDLFAAMGARGPDVVTRTRLAYLALIGEHALGERPALADRLATARRIHALLTGPRDNPSDFLLTVYA